MMHILRTKNLSLMSTERVKKRSFLCVLQPVPCNNYIFYTPGARHTQIFRPRDIHHSNQKNFQQNI